MTVNALTNPSVLDIPMYLYVWSLLVSHPIGHGYRLFSKSVGVKPKLILRVRGWLAATQC